MKGLAHKKSNEPAKEGNASGRHSVRTAAIVFGAAAMAGLFAFSSCNKSPTKPNTNTPSDSTQTKDTTQIKKVNIPQLPSSAPLSCGDSVSNSVGLNAVSIFGNIPLMLDTVLGNDSGKIGTAVIEVIGQDSASYVVCNQLTLAANSSMMIRAGLDSFLVNLNQIYDSGLVNITVTNTCNSPRLVCQSPLPQIGCGTTVIDTAILNQVTYAGQFPIVLTGITDVTTGKSLAAATSTSTAQLQFLMNNCSVDTTATLTVGQPTTVQIGGIYGLVITVQQTVNVAGSAGNSYAVLKIQNICPQ